MCNLYTKLHHRWVSTIGKSQVYLGFSTIHGFRHPLGILDCTPVDEAAAAAAKSLQSCPTLCNPIDGSPPGFAVPGILQARTLEWVAISFSTVDERGPV